MTPRMLDKSRPFGTVHPPLNGMRYEQGGVLYDLDGFPEGFSGNREAASAAPKPAKNKNPPAPAEKPVAMMSTRITDSTGDDDDNNDDEDAADNDDEGEAKPLPENDDDVDLIMWSRGDAKYPFYMVKRVAKAAMPEADVSSTETITAALYEYGYMRKG